MSAAGAMMMTSSRTVVTGETDPNFSSVSLLLQGGYSDGTTTITNRATPSLTIAQQKNNISGGTDAVWKTTQSKFTSSSLYFDGNASLRISNDSAMTAPGDFTWEAWIYQTSKSGFRVWVGGPDVQSRFLLSDNDSSVQPGFYWECRPGTSGGATSTYNLAGNRYNLNTWTHIALVRTGNDFMSYINGTRTQTVNSSVTLDTTDWTEIGSGYTNQYRFIGYMDGIRYTKGVARYTGSTLTVPTAAFPTQ